MQEISGQWPGGRMTVHGNSCDSPPSGGGLTRREILTGMAATALIAATPSVASAAGRKTPAALTQPVSGDIPLQRYMAASAVLTDGRILIAGGYGRRWTGDTAPPPLNSAMILDPSTGVWFAAAPMIVPRARHAAVTLGDGRIAMIGGIGIQPTASVEIYDPWSDSWTIGPALDQPRYDHTAVCNGGEVYVLGGSSQSMVTGVEVLRPDSSSSFTTGP